VQVEPAAGTFKKGAAVSAGGSLKKGAAAAAAAAASTAVSAALTLQETKNSTLDDYSRLQSQ